MTPKRFLLYITYKKNYEASFICFHLHLENSNQMAKKHEHQNIKKHEHQNIKKLSILNQGY